MRILFEGKPKEYIDLYKEAIDEFMTPDEDAPAEIEEFDDLENFDAEELFEILFTIPMTVDDDYCDVIDILADEYLPYDVDADCEDDKTVIYIDDKKVVADSCDDGYLIIRKFNEAIGSEFEIRVMKLSLNEDNVHSLLILPNAEWKELDTKYGEKVAEYFEKISKVKFE
jgi:hypothetical protein